jgi:negative regulator of flagellin synthesis FlgM
VVEPIGIKAGAVVDRRSTPAVASTEPLTKVAQIAGEPRAVETAAAGLSRSMASAAPVDSERVARIRKAIEDGRFPLVPATVADRLLAFKLEWNPDDQA